MGDRAPGRGEIVKFQKRLAGKGSGVSKLAEDTVPSELPGEKKPGAEKKFTPLVTRAIRTGENRS